MLLTTPLTYLTLTKSSLTFDVKTWALIHPGVNSKSTKNAKFVFVTRWNGYCPKYLTKPLTVKLLDFSRNYWLKRGIKDWGIVINE